MTKQEPNETVKNGAPKVLVVEDELLIRWSLREALVEEGFYVLEADSAAQARSCFAEAPDAAILDLRLPDARGTTLLRELRACSKKTVAALMISAYATPEMVEAAKSAGATELVTKPFKVEQVIEALRQAMTAASEDSE